MVEVGETASEPDLTLSTRLLVAIAHRFAVFCAIKGVAMSEPFPVD